MGPRWVKIPLIQSGAFPGLFREGIRPEEVMSPWKPNSRKAN